MNHRSRLAFAASAFLLASTRVLAAAPEPFEFRLDPGKAEEICMRLDVGHGIDFRFQSDAPVDFNLHYHAGNKVLTPIDARAVSKQTGRFVAKARNDYCLMWTAPKGQAAGVTGRWKMLGR